MKLGKLIVESTSEEIKRRFVRSNAVEKHSFRKALELYRLGLLQIRVSEGK